MSFDGRKINTMIPEVALMIATMSMAGTIPKLSAKSSFIRTAEINFHKQCQGPTNSLIYPE